MEFILDICIIFGSNNVNLISDGDNTSYVLDFNCSKDVCSRFILEITLSKSFKIIGGILKYGNSEIHSFSKSSYYFVDINDEGYFSMSHIRLIFFGKMKSMIFIKGGSVCIEYVNIIEEGWIQPLIEVWGIKSSIILELYENNIVNCNYSYVNIESESSTYKSSIIFIHNTSKEDISLNISTCLFDKNVINLFYNDSGYGNICHYSSLNETSSNFFFLFFSFLFPFFLIKVI
jgi:hypothetical protein